MIKVKYLLKYSTSHLWLCYSFEVRTEIVLYAGGGAWQRDATNQQDQ